MAVVSAAVVSILLDSTDMYVIDVVEMTQWNADFRFWFGGKFYALGNSAF